MSTLHERLQDLADASATAERPAPGETWARGVRYARRRRIGTALIAVVAVLALVGIGSLSLTRSHDPVQPAGTNAPLGIPDKLYEPSPWLPGTDDEGPLGPTAALIPAERKSWSGTAEGVVGVSAAAGEYRFLDLPGSAAEEANPSISPDGRHVAYWADGPITGAPQPDAARVGAVAVYDTTTGEVRRSEIPTEHGVAPGEISWLDADTVVLELGRFADYRPEVGNFARFMQARIWSLADPAPIEWDALPLGGSIVAVGDGQALIDIGAPDGTTAVADVRSLRRVTFRSSGNQPALDPTGERLAGVLSNGINQIRIVSSDGNRRNVPGTRRTTDIYAWVDDTHLAYLQRDLDSNRAVLKVMDLTTGNADVLSSYVGNVVSFARDLFAVPPIAAVEPPRPLDPRIVTGGLTVVALAAGVALLLWRRRVQP